MKKIIGFGFIMVLGLMLCGCGNAKEHILECSSTTNTSGMDATISLKATFLDDKVTYILTQTAINLDDMYLPYMDTFVNSVKEGYNDDKYKQDGITIQVNNDEKAIYAVINYDLESMSDKAKSDLNLTDVYGTYDATRDAMIEQGYTCK